MPRHSIDAESNVGADNARKEQALEPRRQSTHSRRANQYLFAMAFAEKWGVQKMLCDTSEVEVWFSKIDLSSIIKANERPYVAIRPYNNSKGRKDCQDRGQNYIEMLGEDGV